ncbi:MAG: CPBP family intramembrane metalloprotease [Planctomycetota bacterium]|nr:CPBP family intramembrane metalloprotease [Planctomycetota bacterium]
MNQNAPPTAQPESYWRETRQPIYSAVLVLPFLLIYEIGLLWLRSDVINGGDAILLHLGGFIMRWMGLGASIMSVLVLVLVFVVAQIKRRGNWAIRPPLLVPLFLESLAYAVLLFMLLGWCIPYLPRGRTSGNEQMRPPPGGAVRAGRPHYGRRDAGGTGGAATSGTYAAHGGGAQVPMASVKPVNRSGIRGFVLDVVLYCGAGVYEELVFRVMLLGLLMLAFTKVFHLEHAYAAVWAVIVGAVIFAGFHHLGGVEGQEFAIGVFLQRVLAGLYFAAIYFNRSFGLAAASHAMYDILVGMKNGLFGGPT